MKAFTALLILLFLGACSNRFHKTNYIEHLDPVANGNKFIDSLRAEGIDTLIAYYEGCSGCIRGFEKSYYIYWVHNDSGYLTKFTNYSNFKAFQSYPPLQYLKENIKSIENGWLNEPKSEWNHFQFQSIYIILGTKEIKYTIPDYVRWVNESAPKVIFIDKIRSKLYGLNPEYWVGLNFKTEKKRSEKN
jgi:hypothetical protein